MKAASLFESGGGSGSCPPIGRPAVAGSAVPSAGDGPSHPWPHQAVAIFDAAGKPRPLAAIQRDVIVALLQFHRFNVLRTAAALGMQRKTLQRYMTKHGLGGGRGHRGPRERAP